MVVPTAKILSIDVINVKDLIRRAEANTFSKINEQAAGGKSVAGGSSFMKSNANTKKDLKYKIKTHSGLIAPVSFWD